LDEAAIAAEKKSKIVCNSYNRYLSIYTTSGDSYDEAFLAGLFEITGLVISAAI